MGFKKEGRHTGFTLIEILVVVAIIAILAAILIPNLFEARARANVARVKADHRVIAGAVEAYAIDHGRGPIGAKEIDFWHYGTKWGFGGPLPDWWPVSLGRQWAQLTTPAAYLGAAPLDPFVNEAMALDAIISNPSLPPDLLEFIDLRMSRTYHYAWYDFLTPDGEWVAIASPAPEHVVDFAAVVYGGHFWSVSSNGPQCIAHQLRPNLLQALAGLAAREDDGFCYLDGFYDPTNGAVSRGMIIRSSAGLLQGMK